MLLSYQELPSHLKGQSLLPLYLISGDVPLLLSKARGAIRQAAQRAGFLQRETFFMDSHSIEHLHHLHLQESINNLNLFSDRSLVEIHNPKAKFDAQGSSIIIRFAENPPSDKLLLIVTEKLSPPQQKTAWFQAVARKGAVISIKPLAFTELLSWIAKRFKEASLTVDKTAIQLLAELTEGNMLATDQAIQKLTLLQPIQPIRVQDLTEVMHSHAKYTVFHLSDAMLMGDSYKTLRILNILFLTGAEPPLILWAITRELRILYRLVNSFEQGKSVRQLLTSQWPSRKALFQQAMARFNTKIIARSLQWAKYIDYIIKGLEIGDSHRELERLCLTLTRAGKLLKESPQ